MQEGMSFLYFKGLEVKISVKGCISVPERSNADPDEMPPFLGHNCLLKYVFTRTQYKRTGH